MRLLKGPTSKEHILMNSGVTLLMVEPLSKIRVQLPSSLILTWAMFSDPLQGMSGSGFRKGTFLDIFMLGEYHLGWPFG